MATVELRFTPLPAHVRTARLVAATLARRHGLDEAAVDEVKLAVGEVCTRAVGLHRAHAADADVVVTFDDHGDYFAVSVRDYGPAGADTAIEATGSEVADVPDIVDLDALTRPDEPGLLPPGFGLAVVAGLVDNLSVTAAEPGTVVRMAWPLKTAD